MAVMGMLMPVAGMIKVRYRGAKADIDSPCGKLHYRATATVCLVFTYSAVCLLLDYVIFYLIQLLVKKVCLFLSGLLHGHPPRHRQRFLWQDHRLLERRHPGKRAQHLLLDPLHIFCAL